jgi:uncharacterized protein YqeY
MLRDDINAALKDAMKAKDQRRVATLRLINAAIQNAELASSAGYTLSDDELQGVLQHMVKQRRDALKLYQKAGRSELAAKEQKEIEIISAYLPKLMSEDEAKTVIAAVVKELDAQSPKDMGKVMTELKARFEGRMDLGKASAVVKAQLSGQ